MSKLTPIEKNFERDVGPLHEQSDRDYMLYKSGWDAKTRQVADRLKELVWIKENKGVCASCQETDCEISHDGDCAWIRKYNTYKLRCEERGDVISSMEHYIKELTAKADVMPLLVTAKEALGRVESILAKLHIGGLR